MKKEDPIGEFKEFTNAIANMEVGDKIDIITVRSFNSDDCNVTNSVYLGMFKKIDANMFKSTNSYDRTINEATVISICLKVTLEKHRKTRVRLFRGDEDSYYSKLLDYKFVSIITNTVLLAGIQRLIGKEV